MNANQRMRLIGGLPCGCVLGEFDCPEAVALWREVNYQYGLLQGYPSTFEGWKDYDEALAKYRSHKGLKYYKEA